MQGLLVLSHSRCHRLAVWLRGAEVREELCRTGTCRVCCQAAGSEYLQWNDDHEDALFSLRQKRLHVAPASAHEDDDLHRLVSASPARATKTHKRTLTVKKRTPRRNVNT